MEILDRSKNFTYIKKKKNEKKYPFFDIAISGNNQNIFMAFSLNLHIFKAAKLATLPGKPEKVREFQN